MGINIKAILGPAAPFLTAALPSPFNLIANATLGQILKVDKANPSQDDLALALAKAPLTGDQMVALKTAELEFQKTMADMGFKDVETLEQIAAGDRDSARKRQVAMKDWTPNILAFVIVAATIAGEGYLLTHGMPPGTDPVIVGRILGTLDMALGLVLGFFYGSSVGENRKTELLAKAPPVQE